MGMGSALKTGLFLQGDSIGENEFLFCTQLSIGESFWARDGGLWLLPLSVLEPLPGLDLCRTCACCHGLCEYRIVLNYSETSLPTFLVYIMNHVIGIVSKKSLLKVTDVFQLVASRSFIVMHLYQIYVHLCELYKIQVRFIFLHDEQC